MLIDIPLQDMIDRMLFAEALETQKCLDEGVLTSTADANIGSIMGIGFPPYTGGSAQFIVGYEGPLRRRQGSVRGPRQGTGRQVRRPVQPAGLADQLVVYAESPGVAMVSGDSAYVGQWHVVVQPDALR